MKLWTPAALLAVVLLFPVAPYAATTPDRLVLPDTAVPSHYDLRIVPDSAHLSFTGSVRIDLQVRQATRQIVLNAADLQFGKVHLSGVKAAPAVSFDTEQQTATLSFPSPVAAGRHVLSIDYSGKINQNAAGLFALDYDTPQGSRRTLFTQFENSDARRFLPCWDEPGLKATFNLTATVPAAQMALSNMPVASTEALPGGLKRVHFAESPKMSSYLLFFGAGDFERVSQKVDGVDVGVVVKRGDTAKASFALDAAVHLLSYYDDYFAVKFPLPKLDLIAGPGASQFFGAMENWGAIFYFEKDLLIDPAISTRKDQREVYITIAHEMAHQWFGDLVTMAWWDDLWLNEGFASWMENKATDHFHPEWKLALEEQYEKEVAMAIDARQGTHPIVTPIRDVLQANEAFDNITYEKGESVIRMLEAYIGEQAFRDGVRRYMKAHAYGNAVTDDLWRELDQTASVNVSSIAHDFTLQPGIPLVRVAPAAGGLQLTQDRFAADDSGKTPLSWRVPVVSQTLGVSEAWHGIVSREQAAQVPAAANAATVVNAGQTGYFRTLYDATQIKPLIAGFHQLSAEDELGLLYDSSALGYAGYEPMSDFLQLAGQASPEVAPSVLSELSEILRKLDIQYDGQPGQERFHAYGRKILEPILAKIGWTAAAGEDQNISLLRACVVRALSRFDDPAVITEARSRFAAYLKDPASLTGDLWHNVLVVVAEHADEAGWEQLHSLARNAGSNLEKEELYTLLGTAQDPALAQKALQLSLTDEVPVTLRPNLIHEVSSRYPEMAFDFISTHLDAVYALLEPDSRDYFLPRLLLTAKSQAAIGKLQAYAEAHIPATARKEAVVVQAAIAYNSEVCSKRLPEIDRWLAQDAPQ
jgi:aminopeptidase N